MHTQAEEVKQTEVGKEFQMLDAADLKASSNCASYGLT
jgi:hypothetical protein